jgi:hypothetical protein
MGNKNTPNNVFLEDPNEAIIKMKSLTPGTQITLCVR